MLTELSPGECWSVGQRGCFGYKRGATRIVAKQGYEMGKINIDITYAKISYIWLWFWRSKPSIK